MKIFYIIVTILMIVLGILSLFNGNANECALCMITACICINSWKIKELEEKR